MLDPSGRFTVPGLPGVSIYPDDRLPGGFYALPAAPRLAVDEAGAPQISLVLYGKKKDGEFQATGGLLALTTTLELSAAEEKALGGGGRLAERLGGAPQRLSPEWLEAEVEVSLIPELTLRGKPSMSGANQCAFNVNLGAEQAKALQKAWSGGLEKASLSYRLQVRAAPRAGSSFELRSSSETVGDGTSSHTTSAYDVRSAVHQAAPLPLLLAGPLAVSGNDLRQRVSTVGL